MENILNTFCKEAKTAKFNIQLRNGVILTGYKIGCYTLHGYVLDNTDSSAYFVASDVLLVVVAEDK